MCDFLCICVSASELLCVCVCVRSAGSRVQYFRLWMRMNGAPKFRNAFWLCLHLLVYSTAFSAYFILCYFILFSYFRDFLVFGFFGVPCGILDCRRCRLKFLYFSACTWVCPPECELHVIMWFTRWVHKWWAGKRVTAVQIVKRNS